MFKIIRISSFGLGSLFIVEFSNGYKRRITEDKPRTLAATKRLLSGSISKGSLKHSMSVGAYDLYEIPIKR